MKFTHLFGGKALFPSGAAWEASSTANRGKIVLVGFMVDPPLVLFEGDNGLAVFYGIDREGEFEGIAVVHDRPFGEEVHVAAKLEGVAGIEEGIVVGRPIIEEWVGEGKGRFLVD